MKNIKTKELVYLGLFISLEVILTRFLSIQTPIVRIGFTFIPVAISAVMFGPLFSGVAAALADVAGMILFPTGPYFPGFTLSAFLSGVIYGVILHDKTITVMRIGLAVIIISILINLGMDTVWLWLLTKKAFLLLLPARIIKCIALIPVQILTIQVIWKLTLCRIKFSYGN